jgi:hypothetical protein
MARPLRLEYRGATYPVLARGNQGRAIFEDGKDRQRFVETLGEACGKTGWDWKAGRAELEGQWKVLRRGWCVGGEPFGARLGETVGRRVHGLRRESHSVCQNSQ